MTAAGQETGPQVAALVEVFRRAEPAMADLPIYRAGLGIEARGFRSFGPDVIGTVITPWCMNLILLPGEASDWSAFPPGAEADLPLPCGTVRFVLARDDHAGDYRVCSLFSPMFEFEDMEAARATADAALIEVLTDPAAAPPPPPPPPREVSRRDLFRRLGT